MMIIAVAAVALGLTPVNKSGEPQLVQVDEAKVVAEMGRYRQFEGVDGRIQVKGFDRLGRAYHIAIDKKGHVEADVGDWYVTFDAAGAS